MRLACCIVITVCSTARAEPPGQTSASAEVEVEPAYAGQILAADGLSVLTAPLGIGLVGYVLGAPLVHAAHGHADRAGESLALRVVLPVTCMMVFDKLATARCTTDSCDELGPVLAGALLGILLASSIDAGYLASAVTKPRSQAWLPSIHPGASGSWSLGIAGSF